jgi:hypothetical protein
MSALNASSPALLVHRNGPIELEGASRTLSEKQSQSEAPDLRGLRGWLIFLGVEFCLAPFSLLNAIGEKAEAFKEQTWNALTVPGSEAYHPLWAPLVIGELVVYLLFLAASLLCLWLFFSRRALFPRVAIAWMLAGVIATVLYLLVVQAIPSVEFNVSAILDVVAAAIVASIWIPYLIRSRRVRATFVGKLTKADARDGLFAPYR